MKIQFIGATGTVTGSKYLLTVGKKNFLVDCGLFQGLKPLRLRNWHSLPVDARAIEAVLLTHAHIDHSGYLPLLVKNGFRGRVYTSSATKALCRILLPDSGHLQEEDALYANKHRFSRHEPALPLYTEKDALESLKYIESVSWEKKVVLSRQSHFQFRPAGHILGACVVQFMGDGRLVTFSGDLGRPKNLIMNPPVTVRQSDYLVLESTYGDRQHPKDDPKEELKHLIHQTVQRGGIVLIPSFAVGRAQEILHLVARLKKAGEIPNIPIYLNSPMGIEATRIFCQFPNDHALSDDECMDLSEVATFVQTVQESKRLNEIKTPALIISASGMATGGRVLHHLKFLAPDPRNLILFVGFQAAGTRGEALLNGKEFIKIHGEKIPVRAEVRSMETLSAHADTDEIIGWLRGFSRHPKMTFITHGEPLASEAMRKRIEEDLHWPCVIPEYLESFNLE